MNHEYQHAEHPDSVNTSDPLGPKKGEESFDQLNDCYVIVFNNIIVHIRGLEL